MFVISGSRQIDNCVACGVFPRQSVQSCGEKLINTLYNLIGVRMSVCLCLCTVTCALQVMNVKSMKPVMKLRCHLIRSVGNQFSHIAGWSALHGS